MHCQIRKKIERWMKEKEIGILPHALLYALSIIYSVGARLKIRLYLSGFLERKELPCKVISIGNITSGGTGKTPFAVWLAGYLKKKNTRVVILSRGYKGSVKGMAVVSDGQKILLGPSEAGDEPYLMARRLKDVPVIVGAERYRSGLYAMENFNPDCIILDDGFQHMKLKRDLDIVLIDAIEGFGNGYLLPRGVLREPVEGLKRAGVVMVKGGILGPEERRALGPVPAIEFSYTPSVVVDLRGNIEREASYLKGKRVVALSGIAKPESFLKTLDALGAIVVKSLNYPDHHTYTTDDVEAMKRELTGAELIVATEKDGVKLKNLIQTLPVYALQIDVEVKGRERLERALKPFVKGEG